MNEEKYIFEEGISNEKFPKPESKGLQKAVKSDYKKALEIILGYSDDDLTNSSGTAYIQPLTTNSDSELIDKAKKFRIKFLEGK